MVVVVEVLVLVVVAAAVAAAASSLPFYHFEMNLVVSRSIDMSSQLISYNASRDNRL